jgi:hypothetical protein
MSLGKPRLIWVDIIETNRKEIRLGCAWDLSHSWYFWVARACIHDTESSWFIGRHLLTG